MVQLLLCCASLITVIVVPIDFEGVFLVSTSEIVVLVLTVEVIVDT